MARELTESNGEVSFTEQVTDSDGNNPFIESVELSQVDGSPAGNPNPSWLSWTSNKTILADGTTQRDVDVTLQTSGLSGLTTYTFEFIGSDGHTSKTRTVDLDVSFSDGVGGVDGTKLFLIVWGENSLQIRQYDQSTPWDIDTNQDTRANIKNDGESFQAAGPLIFNADGTQFISPWGDRLFMYDLSTPFDITTITNPNNPPKESFYPDINDAVSLSFDRVGDKLYIGTKNAEIRSYTLSTPYDITTASAANTVTLSHNPEGMTFKIDGTKLYTIDGNFNNQQTMYQWDLPTPFDVSSRTSQQSINLPEPLSDDTNRALTFRDDGSSFYYLQEGNMRVVKIDLSTPWDITGGTSGSTSPVDLTPNTDDKVRGITFN